MHDIISRYIFKKLFIALFVFAPIVIMVVWLTLSVRFIDFIITDDISILTFLKLISHSIPDVIAIVLPMCALISGINVFYKMQSDKEISIFMTSGRSKLFIASPLLLFSIIVSLSVFYMQTSVIPDSYKSMSSIQRKIQNKISLSVIKPGVFNVLGESVIYIGSKSGNSIKDVFISHIPKTDKQQTNIIVAKEGKYTIENNRLYITLLNGYRQLLDKNNEAVSGLMFEKFSYDVTQFVKKYSEKTVKVHEKTQKELFKDALKTKDPVLKTRYLSEAHGRITMSFIPIINGLIMAIFMISASYRGQRLLNSLKCLGSGVVSQIVMITLVNASRKSEMFINLNYAIIFGAMCLLVYLAFYKNEV